MTRTPLQDELRRIAQTKTWVQMSADADLARSHSWLKNMAERGAWGRETRQGYVKGGRVGPPTPEEFPGLAKLLGTTPEQVARMVAADFYGVHDSTQLSPRTLRIAPLIDELSSKDGDLLELLIDRFRYKQLVPKKRVKDDVL